MEVSKLTHFSKKFILLVFTIVLALTFLGIIYIHPLIWIIPVALILGVLFFILCSNSSVLLPVLTFIVFFQYTLYGTKYQPYLVIWDEVLILTFTAVILLQKMLNGKLSFKKSPFDIYIIVFFLISIFSMFLNNSSFLPGIAGIRNYLQYALLFYCVLNVKITERTIEAVVKAIIFVFILQLPILTFQFFDALNKGGVGVDTLRGTLPGANNLSYAALFPIFLFIGIKNFKFKGLVNKLLLLGLIVVLILGQGRLAVILLPLILLYLLRRQILFRFSTRGFKVVAVIGIFFIMLAGYLFVIKSDVFRQYNLYRHFTKGEFEVHGGSQRYLYYPLVYQHLEDNGLKSILFGLGPGMYGSFAGFRYMTPYTKVLSNVFGQLDYGFDPYVSSQVIPISGELGFIGIIIYFLLLFKVLRYASLAYKKFDQPLIKSLSTGLIAGSFLMIVGSFFNQVFEVQATAYPYWLIAALLVKSLQIKSKRKTPE